MNAWVHLGHSSEVKGQNEAAGERLTLSHEEGTVTTTTLVTHCLWRLDPWQCPMEPGVSVHWAHRSVVKVTSQSIWLVQRRTRYKHATSNS